MITVKSDDEKKIKLKIIEKNNYLYKIKDNNDREYLFTMEFYDIDSYPQVGDYIVIHNELLNEKYEGYSTIYSFGNLENPCGKNNIDINDIDIIKIITANKETTLKRIYG